MSDEIMDLMRVASAQLADGLAPDCYYSASQDLYAHWDAAMGKHVVLRETQQKRFLKGRGLCGLKLPGDNISEVEAHLAKSESSEFRVDYIGEINWLKEGFQKVGNQKFYNLKGHFLPTLIKSKGSTKVIDSGLAAFLRTSDQYWVVKGWLKHAYRCLYDQRFDSGNHTLILLGASQIEAKELQSIFTFLLGGESVDPAHCLSHPHLGLSHSQLARAIHWRVDAGLKNAEVYRKLILANSIYFDNRNHVVPIPFGAQKTVFVGTSATELKKLPPLCFDLGERVHVLCLSPAPEYRFNFEAAKKELGSFIRESLDFSIPSHLAGIQSYLPPETGEILFQASLAGELYHTLCSSNLGTAQKGEAEIGTVFGNNSSFRDRRNWEKESTGALLEIIAHYRPLQVVKLDNGQWKFNLPKTNEPSTFDQ